jgi:hypothetical protein
LLLVLLLASMVVYLAYRRWKDKQITYIREDVRPANTATTTPHRTSALSLKRSRSQAPRVACRMCRVVSCVSCVVLHESSKRAIATT